VRFSQQLLDVNRVGVFGMITNNVFIDGITHRRMRESLKTSFADVRILDLHGSSKKLEETPDGKKDENVFDIQQGVGISLFINPVGECSRKVSHAELWGERASKYDALTRSVASSSRWQTVESAPPHYFFVPKNFDLSSEYRSAPALSDVFPEQNAGIQTKNDGFVYAMTRTAIEERIADLRSERADRIAQKYDLSLDGHWDIHAAKEDICKNKGVFVEVLNKPFDKRWTYYTAKTSGFMARPRAPVMRCGLIPNRILLTVRNPRRGNTDSFFVADTIVDKDGVSPFDNATVFPLYLPIADDGQAELIEDNKLNFGHSFLTALRAKLNLRVGEHDLPAGLTPEDIFHYTYAVFHSPGYRSRYAEFLKIDFPRLPLTSSLDLFLALARLGGELVALHLLESPALENQRTQFVGPSREVVKAGWVDGTVWIDAGGKKSETRPGTSGFRGVPEAVWNFHIGGYQVCEKWLKDRKCRMLTDDDIAHYHKIVISLDETIRLMAEIDEVINHHGGWPDAFQTA
jgi:predicted helicase